MRRILFAVAAAILSLTLTNGQGLDISGYKLIQANSTVTLTIPVGTIIPSGGYVVLGRNTTQASFEAAWGVSLGADVIYINGTAVVGANGFPVINGDETFTLQNASSVTIDGPTIAMPASPGAQSIRRGSPIASPNLEGSWTRNAMATGNPGSGMANTNTGNLIISEFSDAAVFNNEFLELFYDVTPPARGQGTASIAPARWKFNTSTSLQIVFKPQSDTLVGLRIRKPGPINWTSANIAVQPNTAVKTQSGDTTTITNFTLKGTDSLVITISQATATDTTGEFTADIASSKDGVSFLPIQTQPKTLTYGNPRAMSVVKRKGANGLPSLLGKWAVVRGVVTVANDFNGPSYLQDGTAGMAVFDSSVSNNVQVGDDVVLLGLVAPFNNLFEFAPCSLLENISEGNPFDTTVVTIPQVKGQDASEIYESRLIRINDITSVVTTSGQPATAWNVTGSGTNYVLIKGTDSLQIRISPKTNLANLPIPTGQFDVVGALGQFLTNYQLLPRSTSDIVQEGAGPRIVSQPPYESNMTNSSIKFVWQTDVAGSSAVKYGKTTAYGSTVTDTNNVTLHQVTINGLSPATIYNVQLISANPAGSTPSPNYIVSTTSKSSTGTINVYFNKSVNTTLARGEIAQTVDLPSKLINRINAAAYSIDIALYSLSGTVGTNIAGALVTAKGRAVKVRVIGEKANQSSPPWTTLKNAGITVIDDTYDAINAGAGLMHNKFAAIDNRDTTSDTDDWVWSGSWNATDPGSTDDLQNAIEIQDKALANAYTTEFNEMWGSDTDTPNAANSRFGARKFDNTPHLFLIKGVPVESYFSPSDRTTSHILSTIGKAQMSVDFCLLTLTRSDIANALIAKKKAGLKVRGVIDNKTDQGTQFDSLLAHGVDVRLDVNSGFLHHKYGIIDAEGTHAPQYVITGSHNWSGSAESANNENTLIIQSNRIANLYLQEFAARYKESGGKDTITVNVKQEVNAIPSDYSLSQNYPNPFNPSTHFRLSVPETNHPSHGDDGPRFVSLKVYDVLGKEIGMLLHEKMNPGTYTIEWNASGFASGIYFVRLQAGGFSAIRKLVLMK
jgi:phosphatidylserine/phosphatidylglycerophosphate/cardiolipin synthase-like enzyme